MTIEPTMEEVRRAMGWAIGLAGSFISEKNLVNTIAALQACLRRAEQSERLREALAMVEYIDIPTGGTNLVLRCPCCHHAKGISHSKNCQLAAALAGSGLSKVVALRQAVKGESDG